MVDNHAAGLLSKDLGCCDMTRILYQIPGDMTASPLGAAELRRREKILNEWAAPGVTVQVADSPGGPLSIESTAEEFLCVGSMLSALSSRDDVPDAVILGCFGDPGLAALRETFDYPVIGPLESSFHLAAQLGQRVGIVTVLDSLEPLMTTLVRSMGETTNYAGCAAVDIPVLELRKQPQMLVERAVGAARPLVKEKGADAIVLGCMSMSFLDLAAPISDELGIPVVNPARCALKTAEVWVSLGLLQSRRAYPKPRKALRGLGARAGHHIASQ
ncbi:MAG: aspartate/glutamate racemase family protein [Opitutaceae bacterium]